MERYFKGLPFEKVTMGNIECYKAPDGSLYRIDEGKTFVAIESTDDENDARKNIFEDVDLFDKPTPDADLVDAVQSVLKELCTRV